MVMDNFTRQLNISMVSNVVGYIQENRLSKVLIEQVLEVKRPSNKSNLSYFVLRKPEVKPKIFRNRPIKVLTRVTKVA